MHKSILISILIFLLSTFSVAQKKEYYPDSIKYGKVWKQFYAGDHEPELDDPLIAAGKSMTLTICKAIQHRDLKYRRYAIGALGYIGDRRALSTLKGILSDTNELKYFRGDALHSIYQIDESLGTSYAVKYKDANDYLKRMYKYIIAKEKWLKEPTSE